VAARQRKATENRTHHYKIADDYRHDTIPIFSMCKLLRRLRRNPIVFGYPGDFLSTGYRQRREYGGHFGNSGRIRGDFSALFCRPGGWRQLAPGVAQVSESARSAQARGRS
jgi:hypothetical protein